MLFYNTSYADSSVLSDNSSTTISSLTIPFASDNIPLGIGGVQNIGGYNDRFFGEGNDAFARERVSGVVGYQEPTKLLVLDS